MENKLIKSNDERDIESPHPDHADSVLKAKAHYHLAQFSVALKCFQQIADEAWKAKNGDRYLECLLYVIRILLEQERKEELLHVVSRVQSLIETEKVPSFLLAKAHYTLGVLNHSFPHGIEIAREHFQKSIDLSVQLQDYRSLAYAIYGMANVFYEAEEHPNCIVQLDKLDQILQFHSVPDLKVISKLLRAFHLRNEDKTLEALSLLKEACEELRVHPNLYLFLQTLYGFGSAYLKMSDFGSAQIYLELAKASCPATELPRMHRLLVRTFNQCRTQAGAQKSQIAIFDPHNGTFERRGFGVISFQSQFILRDLLAVLLESPGRILSKEELVERVWKESYSPLVHDNKLYVTLKRLRQALEPLFPDFECIIRNRNGYSFNSQIMTRILTGVKSR